MNRRPPQTKPRMEAFDCALNLLAMRDRTRKDIAARLKKKKYSSEEIAAALDKLAEYGYVNDGKFARSYAASRLASGRASRLIRLELLRKGVDRDLAAEVSGEIKQSPSEEVKAALALVGRKLPKNISRDKAATRIAGLLSRRGFSWDAVSAVLKAVLRVSPEETIE